MKWPLTGWLDGLLDLLLPPRCAGCNGPVEPDVVFSAICSLSLLEATNVPRTLEQSLCTTSYSAFYYGGQLASALRRLKYGDAPELARPLGWLLCPALARLAHRLDQIVPVPLHRRRLVARGFNQSQLLALSAVRRLGASLPLDPGLLLRLRDTPPQSRLSPSERRQNLRGAFVARHPARCRGKRLLLVDDVLTTGATAAAAAEALIKAGAAEIHVLTIARAMP